jgi:uncharacterized protein
MRRRTYLWVAQGLTLAAHVVPAWALSAVAPWSLAAALAAGVWIATAWRMHALVHERRRPRWVTRAVDEPMFWLWGGGLLALPAAVVAAALPVGVPVGQRVLAVWLGALALSAWMVWGRRRFVCTRRIEVPVTGLPAAFDGYRIVQLSDLHVGSFDRLERALEWVARANALEADLAVVTGDLVTSGTTFYPDVAEAIGRLRAPDGVLVSMGNHDQWDNPALVREITRRGPRVLLNASVVIERGGAELVVAGIDDRYAERADLDATLAGIPPGRPRVLLSHYPDFFEEAAARGVDLVLSGHTHGGQIGVPGLSGRINVASVSGQRGRGVFRRGGSCLYVNAGLGTTGPPMRLGVPPEIALIVLRAAESPKG